MASTISYYRGGIVGSYDYDPLLWWYSFIDSYILTLGSYLINVYGGYIIDLFFFYEFLPFLKRNKFKSQITINNFLYFKIS